MGLFSRGDVIIAPISLRGDQTGKARPAVVTGVMDRGALLVVPVSSQPPTDAPAVPLSLEDFVLGGLDMFTESYVLVTRVMTIQSREVMGKRGRLSSECMDRIAPLSNHLKK